MVEGVSVEDIRRYVSAIPRAQLEKAFVQVMLQGVKARDVVLQDIYLRGGRRV